MHSKDEDIILPKAFPGLRSVFKALDYGLCFGVLRTRSMSNWVADNYEVYHR